MCPPGFSWSEQTLQALVRTPSAVPRLEEGPCNAFWAPSTPTATSHLCPFLASVRKMKVLRSSKEYQFLSKVYIPPRKRLCPAVGKTLENGEEGAGLGKGRGAPSGLSPDAAGRALPLPVTQRASSALCVGGGTTHLPNSGWDSRKRELVG